jgi:hypothetical protein
MAVHENQIFKRVRKIANSDSFVMSVHPSFRQSSVLLPSWINSAPAGRIFMKFYIWAYKSVDVIQVLLKTDSNGYFTWRPAYIYDNISLNYLYNEKRWHMYTNPYPANVENIVNS